MGSSAGGRGESKGVRAYREGRTVVRAQGQAAAPRAPEAERRGRDWAEGPRDGAFLLSSGRRVGRQVIGSEQHARSVEEFSSYK